MFAIGKKINNSIFKTFHHWFKIIGRGKQYLVLIPHSFLQDSEQTLGATE